MKPGTRVYSPVSNRGGVVVSEPYLPDNGGYGMIVDVRWQNGNRSAIAVRALERVQ